MGVLRGGLSFYGHVLGIIKLETRSPRLLGSVGHAMSFDFPVLYRVIPGATTARVVDQEDASLLKDFVAAAVELERQGVRAITSSCGLLILHQETIRAAVGIPVFISSLLQIPTVYRMLPGKKNRIGILTARTDRLRAAHLEAAGAGGIPVAIRGSENYPAFYRAFVEDGLELDPEAAEADVLRMVESLLQEHADIGAIVCEGSEYSCFADAVRRRFGLPHFDIMTLAQFVYSGLFGEGCGADGYRRTGLA